MVGAVISSPAVNAGCRLARDSKPGRPAERNWRGLRFRGQQVGLGHDARHFAAQLQHGHAADPVLCQQPGDLLVRGSPVNRDHGGRHHIAKPAGPPVDTRVLAGATLVRPVGWCRRRRPRAGRLQSFSAWQSQDLWPLAAGFPGELHKKWREGPEETRSNGTGRRDRNRAPRNQNPREAEASLSRFPVSQRLQGFGPDLSGHWTVGGQIAARWNWVISDAPRKGRLR